MNGAFVKIMLEARKSVGWKIIDFLVSLWVEKKKPNKTCISWIYDLHEVDWMVTIMKVLLGGFRERGNSWSPISAAISTSSMELSCAATSSTKSYPSWRSLSYLPGLAGCTVSFFVTVNRIMLLLGVSEWHIYYAMTFDCWILTWVGDEFSLVYNVSGKQFCVLVQVMHGDMMNGY